MKHVPLTPRELELVEAVQGGALRYSAIARALDVSERTVETMLRAIATKIGGEGPPLATVVYYAGIRENPDSAGLTEGVDS